MPKKLTIEEAKKAIDFIYESNDLQGCFTIARKLEDDIEGNLHFAVPTADEAIDSKNGVTRKDNLSSFFFQSNKQVVMLFKGIIGIMVGQFSFGNMSAENIEEEFNKGNKLRLEGSLEHVEKNAKELKLKPIQVNQIRQLHQAMWGDYYGATKN